MRFALSNITGVPFDSNHNVSAGNYINPSAEAQFPLDSNHNEVPGLFPTPFGNKTGKLILTRPGGFAPWTPGQEKKEKKSGFKR